MTETMRRSIFNEFAQAWGEERAAAFMAAIPTIPWQDFATKADLAALKEWAELKFDAQSAEMHGQFSLLRGEISKLEGNLFGQLAEQKADTAEQFSALANQMAEQKRDTAEQLAALAKDTAEQLAEQKRDTAERFAAQTRDNAKQNRAIVLSMAGFALTLYATLIGGLIFT